MPSIYKIHPAIGPGNLSVHLATGRGRSRPRKHGASSGSHHRPGYPYGHWPDQRHMLDDGRIHFSGEAEVTVPLGEIRTDDVGRLLVLRGAGTSASPAGNLIGNFWANAGWYDDASDGQANN